MVAIRNPTKIDATGTGTVEIPNRKAAIYICTDGVTGTANCTFRNLNVSGDIVFAWDSAVPVASWPAIVPSGTLYYDVTLSGAFVLIYDTVDFV
jgi:hypothetical protein